MHSTIAITIPVIELRATRLLKRIMEDPRIDHNTKYECRTELSEIISQSQHIVSEARIDLSDKVQDFEKWHARSNIPKELTTFRNFATRLQSGNDLTWFGACPHKDLSGHYEDCHDCASCSWRGYDDFNWWNRVSTTEASNTKEIRCNAATTRRFTIDFKTGEFTVAVVKTDA